MAQTSLRTYGILLSLWLMVFTAASQTIIVTPILPLIGEELGVAASLLGLLVTVYSLALAVAAVVMGPISDRIGRRQVLLIGSGTLAVMLLLHGLVQTVRGAARRAGARGRGGRDAQRRRRLVRRRLLPVRAARVGDGLGDERRRVRPRHRHPARARARRRVELPGAVSRVLRADGGGVAY